MLVCSRTAVRTCFLASTILVLWGCDSSGGETRCTAPIPSISTDPLEMTLFADAALPLSRWFQSSAASLTYAPEPTADADVRVESTGGVPTLLVSARRSGDIAFTVMATNACGARARLPVRFRVDGTRVYDGRTVRAVTTSPPVSPALTDGMLPDVVHHNANSGQAIVLEQATLTLDHRTRTDASARLVLRFTSCSTTFTGSASLSGTATTVTVPLLSIAEQTAGTLRAGGTFPSCAVSSLTLADLVLAPRG